MEKRVCPNCFCENDSSRESCCECGEILARAQDDNPTAKVPQSQSVSVQETILQKRYPALRAIASTLQTFAYIILVLIGILVIIVGVQGGFLAFVGALMAGGVIGGLVWIFLKSYSELIYVQLDIEANTRQVAEVLSKSPQKK